MRLNTLDLYHINQCSLRWIKEPPETEPKDPTQELLRRILLMKSIGRDTGWDFKGIATAWDQVFWHDKEINQQSMKESVHGILAARQLHRRLPKGKLETHSVKNLTTSLDSEIVLDSSGDFLLSYPDRYETWIYSCSTPKEIRRSPLPMLEHFLLNQKVRQAHSKPFYLTIYYSSIKRRRIVNFRIRDEHTEEECRRIAYLLSDQAKKEIHYPSIGEYCKNCTVGC